MPARADLSLGAGDLLASEVDGEGVAVEAVVADVMAGGVAVVRVHEELPEGLDTGTERVACAMRVKMVQQLYGVLAGVGDPGLGPGGVAAQSDRAAVAACPLFIYQPGEQLPGRRRRSPP